MLNKGNPPPPRSNKGQKRRSAIALGVGTCLVMGILAMEVIRRQELDLNSSTPHKTKPLIVLKNPDDLKLHKDLNQLETRIQESKRLLFSRENALETDRVKALRERLNHSENYVRDLEQKLDDLKLSLSEERQRSQEYDKTATALVDTIELQKNAKESIQQRLLGEIEDLNRTYSAGKEDLQNQLAEKEANEQALKDTLAQKERELADIQSQLDQKHQDYNNVQETSKEVEIHRNSLTEEINLIHDKLEVNEQHARDLENALQRSEEEHADRLKELEEALDRTKSAYNELNDSYSALANRARGLEVALENKDRENNELLARLEQESRTKQMIADASDDFRERAGESLAGRESDLQLQQAYSEMALHRLKQDAERAAMERDALSENLKDLKRQIAFKTQELSQLEDQHADRLADIENLRNDLDTERAKAGALEYTLQNRPPVRDMEKEEALSKELAFEKECTSRLQQDLSEQVRTQDNLETALAQLENTLLEARGRSNELSQRESSLQDAIAELEVQLVKEKQEQEELQSTIDKNRQDKEALNSRIQDLQNQIDQAQSDKKAGEDQLQEEQQKFDAAYNNLRQQHEDLSQVLSDERAKKAALEEEIAFLNTRINNISLSQDDIESSYKEQLDLMRSTLTTTKNEADSLAYHLEVEQNKKIALEHELSHLQETIESSYQEHLNQQNALKNQISSLEKNLSEAEGQLQENANHFEAQAVAREELERTKASLAEEIAQVRQEKSILENELKAQAEEHSASIDSMKASSEELSRAIQNEAAQKTALERELNELKDNYETALLDIQKARFTIAELENREPIRDTSREEWLASELDKQGQEVARLQSQIDDLEAWANGLAKEKQSLEQEIARSQEVLSRAADQDNELKSRIAELEEALNSLDMSSYETP